MKTLTTDELIELIRLDCDCCMGITVNEAEEMTATRENQRFAILRLEKTLEKAFKSLGIKEV